METFIKSEKKKGKNLINIGYDIQLIFTDVNGNNPKIINSTAYNTESDYIFQKSENIKIGLNTIANNMVPRFEKYIKNGADFIQLNGFEIEVED